MRRDILPPALDPGPGGAVVHLEGEDSWRRFVRPVETLVARAGDEILPLVQEVESRCLEGAVAVGFLSYEAASVLDPVLSTRDPGDLPLALFTLYRDSHPVAPPLPQWGGFHRGPWEPSLGEAGYFRAMKAIREAISRGDTYQVNFTFRQDATFDGSPWAFFKSLSAAQGNALSTYLDAGRFAICSVSPELFFRHVEGSIVTRPMKGTASRHPRPDLDAEAGAELQASAKDQAENVMIVDMMRNDLGKIAAPGSVQVPALFQIERHETVWQMTSTVTAQSSCSLVEMLPALFPCASVTGAPKARTMELIRELENRPRGVYTGAIGVVGPGSRAQFTVGIRTAVVDREKGRVEYGVGSGVVWDSDPQRELQECRVKGLVSSLPPRRFDLLESMLWRPGAGYVLLERHLQRLATSARYFDYPLPDDLEERLGSFGGELSGARFKVRLTLSKRGDIGLSAQPLPAGRGRPWRVALALDNVLSAEPLLYHKTTLRDVYDEARKNRSDVDDVILWNEREELTESTVANLVIRRGGELVTPPRSSGLLAGTLRAELLERGRIREEVLTVDHLRRAHGVFLINSVRGWIPAVLVEQQED